jgi:tetraacyldisaccharide 4'-kinase
MNLPMLAPLSWVYASLVRSRNARFDRSTPHQLRWPVISVGNLSVGGAGKTPFVICLARMLQHQQYQVDVLSRGYGRARSTVERVDPKGTAEQFGDEPLLIAQSAGVPVYVGASRYEAGLLAESGFATDRSHLHLLDDGLQHRQLARTIEIVLLHRSDLQQRLLPAGRLREPLSSLSRADVIVLRQEDAELITQLRRYASRDCYFWQVRRTLTLANPASRALAFCAIARPTEFFQALTIAGVGVAERMAFRDHHTYSLADMERLAVLGKRSGCDAFVTTQKDAVKLDAGMRARLNAVAPLQTAELTVEIDDEVLALCQLVALLDVRKSPIVTAK